MLGRKLLSVSNFGIVFTCVAINLACCSRNVFRNRRLYPFVFYEQTPSEPQKALAGLPVLSQTEIAARWKLGPDTVRKLIKDHNIPTAPGPWKRARYVISDIWRVEGVSAALMGDPGHHEALLSPLLTADDLARWLGCVPATVRSYAREGLLKPIRLGSTIRFRLSDVSSLLGDV